MKKSMRVFFSLAAAVILISLSLPALAAENPAVSVPVSIALENALEVSEDYTVVLKADDASYPMPEGSSDGELKTVIKGEASVNLPSISYNHVGIYTYTIFEEVGANEKCTYDSTVYTLTVYITNEEDGSGLEATAVLYPKTQGVKLSCAEFKNVYEPEPTPEPTNTPSPSPSVTPSVTPSVSPSVTPSVSPSVTPSATPNVTPSVTPSAAPTKVPTNSDTPKTGDDFKPVLYGALFGVSLVAIVGMFFTRKNKSEK